MVPLMRLMRRICEPGSVETPKMFHRCALGLGTVLLLAPAAPQTCRAEIPSIPELRSILKSQWDSIATVEHTCHEYMPDPERPGKFKPAYFVYETSRSKGGLTSYRVASILSDARRVEIARLIEDGNKRHDYKFFDRHPDVMSTVKISRQPSIDGALENTTNSPIAWLTTPGSKPIHEHFTDSIKLASVEDGDAKCIEATFPINKYSSVRCLLDPDHDWLAKRVELLNDDGMKWVVTKFQRDNGRWFPEEGTWTALVAGRPTEMHFVVSNLKINRDIPPSRFKPLAITKDAWVTDVISDKQYIWQGTLASRRQLEVRSTTTPGTDRVPEGPSRNADSLVASADPAGIQLGWMTAAGSLGILLVAGLLKVARKSA
ncbi:hypothetical protein [Planctomyces sp. SH-PL62]|uniref:hypothetical protein n=1 Tax=Planctomyces sp. SH-PL62 TaxID=1636152 RepID=UPI00078E1686|nr:hypothetical protein [Planctomyces sp. SH-PL62]AMV40617.1 hypothetical protein VT85_24515 [Planctomyces sp. SH-PL62]